MKSSATIAAHKKLFGLFLLGFSLFFPNKALTQTDTLKEYHIPDIVIRGNVPFGEHAVVLQRPILDQLQLKTVGGTLSNFPGIQNSYFGPNSGAPVIRSLSGERVRVLFNHLPANDLSGMSPNFNLNLDMDDVRSITVYKQSASVLYGGRAIGGAVNINDQVIPIERTDEALQGKIKLELGTNSGHKQSLNVQANLGRNWAFTLGGMNRKHGNLRIPGNTKAPIAYDPQVDDITAAMAQVDLEKETTRNLSLYPYISEYVRKHLDDPEWGLSEADLYTREPYSYIDGQQVANEPNPVFVPDQDPNTPEYHTVVKRITDYAPVTPGLMPNSHAESRSVHLGTSFLRENFRIGMGYRALEGFYGVPGFAQLSPVGHTHDPNPVQAPYEPINTRALSHLIRLEGAYRSESPVVQNLRFAYTAEYADDRELVGVYRVNTLRNHRHAARTEALQQLLPFWSANSGVDFSFLEINGEGTRRFLPNNLSRELGVFTTHRISWDSFTWNVGYRHDFASRRALYDAEYQPGRGLAGGKLSPRDFDLNQFSTDLSWKLWDYGYLRGSFSHAERAPGINELYAGNDHFAILVEENGDDRLGKEVARGFEFAAGAHHAGLRLSASYYQTDFQNYLYLAHTGLSRAGGFLVKEWRAGDTRIQGWELEGTYRKAFPSGLRYELGGFMDLVKNENTSNDEMRDWAEGDFMPNLPTSRFGLSSQVDFRRWQLAVRFQRYLKQRFLGKNIRPERAMPPYSLLSAHAAFSFVGFNWLFTVYLQGDNILNVTARPQNSLLKYLAPLPGRNITMGIKADL